MLRISPLISITRIFLTQLRVRTIAIGSCPGRIGGHRAPQRGAHLGRIRGIEITGRVLLEIAQGIQCRLITAAFDIGKIFTAELGIETAQIHCTLGPNPPLVGRMIISNGLHTIKIFQ